MRAWMLILLLGALCLAGCSGLIASKDVSLQMDVQASKARDALASPITGEPARAALAANAEVFGGWRSAATMNPFAYAFGDKQILCTATYYQLLTRSAGASAAFAENADRYTESTVNLLLSEEWKWFLLVQKARDGKE